jgi:hypothetical protein
VEWLIIDEADKLFEVTKYNAVHGLHHEPPLVSLVKVEWLIIDVADKLFEVMKYITVLSPEYIFNREPAFVIPAKVEWLIIDVADNLFEVVPVPVMKYSTWSTS